MEKSSAGGDFLSVKTCQECGKKFTVLYPQLWTYKRQHGSSGKYWCSWKCLRATEKKGEKKKVGKKRIFTKEMEQEAVTIALSGGNPLEYLEQCGGTNAPQKWYDIKVKLKENDPETYAKLPAKLPRRDGRKTIETPEGEFAGKVEVPEASCVKGPVTADELYERFDKFVEVKDVQIPEEPEEDDLKNTAVLHDLFGEFYYDHKFGCIDWRTPEGDEVSMKVDVWKKLYEAFPRIMNRLEVEL